MRNMKGNEEWPPLKRGTIEGMKIATKHRDNHSSPVMEAGVRLPAPPAPHIYTPRHASTPMEVYGCWRYTGSVEVAAMMSSGGTINEVSPAWRGDHSLLNLLSGRP